MRGNSDSIKRLKAEIAAVGKEIDHRIDRLEKLPDEIDKNCKALKTYIDDRQDDLNAQFRKAYMNKGQEVWDFCWDNIWEMVRNYQRKASILDLYGYPELEPLLKARQTSLGRSLKLHAMWADPVWNEVWTAVRHEVQHAIDHYRHQAKAEFERCGHELDPLLEHKAALKRELEGLQHTGDGMYNALKKTFHTDGKDKHH